MSNYELEPFETLMPSDKIILCSRCNGNPLSISYREMIPCPSCDGEGCLGMAQCRACNTDGSILVDRRGCPDCDARGLYSIYADTVDLFGIPKWDAIEWYDKQPMEIPEWQQLTVDFIEESFWDARPVLGEPGSVHEGTVILRHLGDVWRSSESNTLYKFMEHLADKGFPFGLVCFFYDEGHNQCLQVFPPRS